MNLLALEKARSRLRLTARAVKELEGVGTDPVAFDDHWTDFLVHWKGTYTKVEQAAKDTPQEVQWFKAGVAKERRSDPLLRWLFEARNDEEHGLVRSAVNTPHLVMFRPKNDATVHSLNLAPDGSMRALDESGNEIEGEYGEPRPAESALQPVTERNGTIIPPPTAHQGQPMEPKPLVAAQLGLQWLASLVRTAEALQTP